MIRKHDRLAQPGDHAGPHAANGAARDEGAVGTARGQAAGRALHESPVGWPPHDGPVGGAARADAVGGAARADAVGGGLGEGAGAAARENHLAIGGNGGPPAGEGWRGRVASALRFAAGQLAGDGDVDEFGFDPEFNSRLLIPLARLLYREWFRVRMRGVEHVPAAGPVLVVANHSGTLPLDAIMLQTGLHDEHPAHRNLRLLGADLVYEVPLLGGVARRAGHIRASPANAQALLSAGKAVGVFPEGFKGIGKPFSERYQLQRFGRGGFAATAIRAGVPIVPCAIVGAEEIYPMIGNAKRVAGLLGLPYFPITPLFPWLGPLGAVPLPSRWIIEFCPPVGTDEYGPGAEHDQAAVADLSGRVRGIVQRKLDDLLAERGPAFA
jgi:1-acyl-sn-glycerol-3-phosphate acyltransferase